MIEKYKSDKYFGSIYEILTQNTKPLTAKEVARVKYYKLYQKRIYFKKGMRLAIPKDKELRTKILQDKVIFLAKNRSRYLQIHSNL